MSHAPLDWQQVYQRLEVARANIEQNFASDAKRKEDILKKRAQALAQEPICEIADEAYFEVVEFELGRERYAVETSCIREVYPLKELTPLPCTPPFVLGIINVRGQILSVLDLKEFFRLPEKGLTDLNKVIILHSECMEFGILADAINGVRSIPRSNFQSSLPTLSDRRSEYLHGVTAERLILLDAGKILADESIVVYEEL